MNKNLFILITSLIISGFSNIESKASITGYKICLRVAGLKDTVAFLANYYGDKTYLKDTAKVDANGRFTFIGKEKLEGGIYLAVLPKNKFFEFMVDTEQEFSMETDTANLVTSMKVKGSSDNTLFYEYLKFLNGKQKESENLKNELKKAKTAADSSKIKDRMKQIDKEVKDYKINIINNKPKTFLAAVFKCSQEPEIPEIPILPNGRKDSTFAYRYFKSHYWDAVDFSDDRMLRTPIFHSKLKQYMSSLVVQMPDSINYDADLLIAKAKGNKEIFRYIVWYVTNTYETSNIMGMDAVFVHMAKKYYLSNDAWWITPEQLKKIAERVTKIEPILIGKIAPNLVLSDTAGRLISMHNIKSKITLLYFWDPECGHCKTETPKLLKFYNENKQKGIEVYAVYAEDHESTWKNYIKTNQLNWINVGDHNGTFSFKYTYDIYSTPVIYVLDENKKIIAKRIGVEQLDGFLGKTLLNDSSKKN